MWLGATSRGYCASGVMFIVVIAPGGLMPVELCQDDVVRALAAVADVAARGAVATEAHCPAAAARLAAHTSDVDR
jgi:hypothetical protein